MIKTTAIIGMGALGLMYAEVIARGGEQVAFVMDKERVMKYRDTAFSINGETKSFELISQDEAKPVDLLIVAVKKPALETALDTMKNCIGEHTIILSVMNGIDSEQIIARRYGMEHLVDTVAQGMDASKIGAELTYSKMGELHIGVEEGQQREKLLAVAEFFDRVKMPYVVEEDILYRMWAKFMLNVGINQTCLAYETTYGGAITEGTKAYETLIAAMEETIQVANAEGIGLTRQDLTDYIAILKTLDPNAFPSMRQDGVQKRYSEVEMFAGTMIRLAGKHNIAVPANEFLYKRIKEIEATY